MAKKRDSSSDYDVGGDIKQRPIPTEDKSWRSAGGYNKTGYVLGTSGEYPESDDSEGTYKEYSPADPNCGGASGTFKGYEPKDPNRS